MTNANGRWKSRLRESLKALRPAYGAGAVRFKTMVNEKTLRQFNSLFPRGSGQAGGGVTDTALRLFLALVQPDAAEAQRLGLQLGETLAAHPDLVERITDNLITLLDSLRAPRGLL
mgnify:CR=1 FL=1